MAKYAALVLLWSPSLGKYIEPGEVMEISDEDAASQLMDAGAITVADASDASASIEVPGEPGEEKA